MQIETERLIIDELTVNDVDFVIELLNQPSFKENIGERHVNDTYSAINFLEEGPFSTYADDIGMHCVRLKETGKPVGFCGLMQRDYFILPDVGYAFLERFHGLGYAREATKSVIHWASVKRRYNRLCAMTNLDNHNSINLLNKLGFDELAMPKVPPEITSLRYFELRLD